MGNVSGYVKIQDNLKSARHFIRINKLHEKYWTDRHVYDFKKNEIGILEDGRYYTNYASYTHPTLGKCYNYYDLRKDMFFNGKQFLEYLKNAAAEYIGKVQHIPDIHHYYPLYENKPIIYFLY